MLFRKYSIKTFIFVVCLYRTMKSDALSHAALSHAAFHVTYRKDTKLT